MLIPGLLLLAAPVPAQDLIFSDDFETGGTTAWSATVPPIPPPTDLMFCDGFEDGELDPEFWQATPANPGGVVDVVANVGAIDASSEGIYGVVLGRSEDGGFASNTLDLHLDLSTVGQLDLSFWIQDLNDESHVEDGVFFSDDGGQTFEKAFAFDGSQWTDYVFGQLPPLDVDHLAADLGLTLSDDFIIRFQQHDNDDFDFDGIALDDIKLKDPELTASPLPFTEDFESGHLTSPWRWATPTNTSFADTVRPQGVVLVTSNIQGVETAHQGIFGLAMGRRTNGNFTSNAADLHLDLSGETAAELRFWIKDNNDETHTVDGLYLSGDGGDSFTKIYDFDPSSWSDDLYGQLPPIDLARALSDLGLAFSDQVVLRFQQYDNDDFVFDGLLIDDVAVTVPELVWAVPPLSDGFESGDLGPAWAWSDPLRPTSTTLDGTVRPGGLVEVTSSRMGIDAAHLGFFGVAMGRRSDGNFTTNALDLHLDLSSTPQVELRFWLKDNGDETHDQDGLYFSSNGGENFRKAVDLSLSSVTDHVYQEMVVDIDAITAALGLTLTDRFVIRFQQYDNDGFGFDGIFLDDVAVITP